MTSTSPLIHFDQVNFSFHQPPKTILKNFNFSIYPKDKIIVFGKSGSGKSTLINLILGFYQPQKGTIFYKNQPLNPTTIWQLRRHIAYVDQDATLGQGIVKNIFQEYLHFQANRHLKLKPSTFTRYFNSLGLSPNLLQKDVSQVSGGERQRLALSLALLLDRPILLLDEVTSALDPESKQLVVKLITQLTNKTILLVTHDKIWKQQAQFKLFDFKEKQ